MPSWIVENPTPVCVLLGLLAFGLAMAFWIRQERKFAVALAIVVGLLFLVLLLDYLVVTDRERIVLHVRSMSDSVQRKDVDGIFAHISESFQVDTENKKAFRGWVERTIRDRDVTELKVWDFEPGELSSDRKMSKVTFAVKGRGNAVPEAFFRCVATFVLDPDGQWRLKEFELYDPIKDPASKDKIHYTFH